MMRLPRPASPRALFKDVRALVGERGAHRWIAGFFALLIPAIILLVFAADVRNASDAPEQIIYVESWPANRSIEETIEKQKADQVLREEWQAEWRRQFQRLDNRLNEIGI